jgi:HK97 gp10 family phage protein
MSAKVFRAKIEGWKNATKAQIEGIARQTCMEMSERVVRATPVDTGFLRGSWQPALNEVRNEKGSPDPAGAQTIAKVMTVGNAVTPGDRYYMTNNANYAKFVEYGTVKMAGRFYVQNTVKQWQAVVSQVAAELGLKK